MDYNKFQFITLVQNKFLHDSLVHRTMSEELLLPDKDRHEKSKIGYVDGWMGDAFRAVDKMPNNLSTQQIIEAAYLFVSFHYGEPVDPLPWFLV